MQKLPLVLKPYFWSYDFSKLDIESDRRLIIFNIMNYGDLKDWQWLVKKYGKEEIKRVVLKIPASEFRPEVLKLIYLLFSIKKHASRNFR